MRNAIRTLVIAAALAVAVPAVADPAKAPVPAAGAEANPAPASASPAPAPPGATAADHTTAAPSPDPAGSDHGLRIFSGLDEGADFFVDGKPVGHVNANTDVSLGISLGDHKIDLKTPSGDAASADLSLDDTDDVMWHGNKFWCLQVRYNNDKDIEFSLATAQSCTSMLADVDATPGK